VLARYKRSGEGESPWFGPHADRIKTWLGLEPNIMVMLVTFLILGMGEELWTRFIPKYLEFLGASVWVIALYGTLKDLIDAVYQYPGGWLADRLGRRSALVLFTVLAIIGYTVYLFSTSWEWMLFGTIFVMAWSSLTLPAVFAIIGDNLPQTHRAIGFGVQSGLKRIPIVLGPVIGGLLITTLGFSLGIKAGLVITILLAVAALFLVRRFYSESSPKPDTTTSFTGIWRSLDVRLKRLLVADSLARWAEGIPKVFIILYFIDSLKGDAFQFGWLTGIQQLTAILIYIPIAKLSDKVNRKPFVLLTFSFFALFPLTLVTAQELIWVVVAFIISGLREIGEPARKAYIVDLAPETARGRVVGMYYLIRGLAVFPASLVGGWLWAIDVRLPFYTAFVVGVVACIFYGVSSSKEK